MAWFDPGEKDLSAALEMMGVLTGAPQRCGMAGTTRRNSRAEFTEETDGRQGQ
jgi:hypothetical protein